MKTTPELIDLLIEPRWMAAVEPDVVLNHHAIAVHEGQIVALLPSGEARSRFTPVQRVVLEDHLLIPGLVNLHTHAAMPLMEWLERHIWPAETAHVSPQFVHDGTRLACAEMLAGGITCFNDMYFFPEAAAAAAAEFGMRATLGITALEFPTPYASDADDYIDKGLAAREQWINHPPISFCLAPHAPYTVADATFERLVTLATLNGANALGLGSEIGSISPGKSADLVAISFKGLNTKPCYDPVSHLVHVADRECVTHVWIAGKCCVDHKTLVGEGQNDLESAIALWQNRLEVRRES